MRRKLIDVRLALDAKMCERLDEVVKDHAIKPTRNQVIRHLLEKGLDAERQGRAANQ